LLSGAWIQAFTGMTVLIALSVIATQSQSGAVKRIIFKSMALTQEYQVNSIITKKYFWTNEHKNSK
jgi:hypothetical protein